MAKPPAKLPLAVLLGSGREASNTGKVTSLLLDELKAVGAEVDLMDPRVLPLEIPGLNSTGAKALEDELKRRVLASRGAVLITPEYDGSYSAVMKIMVEYLGYPSVLDKKPVLIVGVAAGGIGATRAVEHLRSVCFHIGAYVMPGMVSVAHVHKLFDPAGNCLIPETEATLRGAVRDFARFAQSF